MVFSKLRNIFREIDIYDRTLSQILVLGSKLGGDYRSIDFLGPIGWALIASYSKRNRCKLTTDSFQSNVASYMSFIGLLNSEQPCSRNNNEHIIPLKSISPMTDCDAIAEKVCEISLKFLSERDDELYSNLRYFISEFALNIPHHSQDKETAFICGQFYKKAGVLQIAIVDSGIGIYESLRHTQAIGGHKEALEKAITPGITGNPGTSAYGVGHRNMGYGIPTCKKTIESNSGDFFIGSGNYLIAFNGKGTENDENYVAEYIELPFNWQGTFIVFNLYTKKDQNVDYACIYSQLPDQSEVIELDFI